MCMFQKLSQRLVPSRAFRARQLCHLSRLITFLKGSGCLGPLSQLSHPSAVSPWANDLMALNSSDLILTMVAFWPIGKEKVAVFLASWKGPKCAEDLCRTRVDSLGQPGVHEVSSALLIPRNSNSSLLEGSVGAEPPSPPASSLKADRHGPFLEGLMRCSPHSLCKQSDIQGQAPQMQVIP